MYIPVINAEDLYEEELRDYNKSTFINSVDILDSRRNILIHKNDTTSQACLDGVYNIRCTIINLSVLNGCYHQDANFNPERVLVKTIYNGYITIHSAEHPNFNKINRKILLDSTFRILNAYTSYMGVWSNNIGELEYFSPLGVSMLNMFNIGNAHRQFRKQVDIIGDHISVKFDISFDGKNFETILPLPYPQFYSSVHSQMHRSIPIITHNKLIRFEDLNDDNTKISLVNFKKLTVSGGYTHYETTADDSLMVYYDIDGNIMRFNDFPDSDTQMPLHIACGMIGTFCDNLYAKTFKLFNTFLLSSMDFLYDSVENLFTIKSLKFSYQQVPRGFVETVIYEFLCDKEILTALADISTYYGDVRVIGRITDLKYDLVITFINGHNNVKRLKTIEYSTLIFDIFNTINAFESDIKRPITML